MSTVPVKDLDVIQFFEFHYPVWNSAPPASIGLTPAQLTALDTATKAARNTYTAQQSAKNAAKAATVNFRTAIGALRNSGADLVKAIRAFAQTSNNPAVYSLAQIDPPAPPAPRPAPGQPNDFTVTLSTEGAIVLKWKATNAAASSGVYFNVRRKLAGDETYTIIGNTGSKSFVDDTLPFGTTSATYIIQGYRGTQAGEASDQFVVQFGVGGNGFAEMKLAA
jgi:hypothetical protein